MITDTDTEIEASEAADYTPIDRAGRSRVPQLGVMHFKQPWRGMSLIKCCGQLRNVFKDDTWTCMICNTRHEIPA